MNLHNRACETTREQLSAWMDDALDSAGLARLLAALPQPGADADVSRGTSASACATVQSYMVIGEVLRTGCAVGAAHADAGVFLQQLQARLAQEPPWTASQPQPGEVPAPALDAAPAAPAVQAGTALGAANQAVFRWKLVAGLASMAAVALLGWGSLDLSLGQGHTGGSVQLASAHVAGQGAAASAAVPRGLAQLAVVQNASLMQREPGIDAVRAVQAARAQWGGTANLQMPAGFLRNASFSAVRSGSGDGCGDARKLC